ncbi:MAG TPA: HAD family hydrolase [Candidatus Pullichristensenella excrementigallinarum]|uniref:HAD family hydrolase n=1 Tax=Candidatus Pullichristensenella excrementigallinarum TaxID=2840907 RepID=A0A9D1IAJ9_9FIRM|nr:HAD family hydrolase [Candidatus Pullichristensenella excrementigallinarum]
MTGGIEFVREGRTGNFRYAVLDFDGTISLVREGWQQIMIPYFADELAKTPVGRDMPWDALELKAREFITLLTGKQTIYQCIHLAEEITAMGGKPEDPQAYKDEYHRRLLVHIDDRLKGLASGTIDPETLVVPGSYDLLEMLLRHNVTPYLASGTDEVYVLEEARLIRVDKYFGPHIYGAQREYKTFSKKMVIERILRENHLSGEELLGFGDGYVEIENIRDAGGFAVGVASNEAERQGIDEWKRERLIRAGANLIIPDYRDIASLEAALFDR